MRFVQIVLTDTQVGMLAVAAHNAAVRTRNETEKEQLLALAAFMSAVEAEPERHPVTDSAARRTIRKRISAIKGTSQPQGGRPNRRKRTQARKIGFQKRTRAMRREEARIWNEVVEAAQAALEIERAEAERVRAESLGIVLPGSE